MLKVTAIFAVGLLTALSLSASATPFKGTYEVAVDTVNVSEATLGLLGFGLLIVGLIIRRVRCPREAGLPR